MAERTIFVPDPPVCPDSNPVVEALTDVVKGQFTFLAAVPKSKREFPGEPRAATEGLYAEMADRLVEYRERSEEPPGAGAQGGSCLHVEARLGFDLHWLREVVPGSLEGVAGLRLPATEPFEAWIDVGPEGEGTGAWVVIPHAQEPHASPLVLALLGIHPLEWAWSACTEVGSLTWRSLGHETRVQVDDMDEYNRLWRSIAADGRARIWAVAGSDESMDRLACELDQENSRPEAPLSSPAKNILRILSVPRLRRVLRYVHDQAVDHLEPQKLSRAFGDPGEFLALESWVRRRLCTHLNVPSSEVFKAVQERVQQLSVLEMRIRSLSREILANQLIADVPDRRMLRKDRYVSVLLPFIDRKRLLKRPFDWSQPTLTSAGRTTVFVGTAGENPMLSMTESEVAATLATPFRHTEVTGIPQYGELSFTHRRTSRLDWNDPFWRDIVVRYGFPEGLARENSILSVVTPLGQLSAWSRLPGPREPGFLILMIKMAQALQRTLRLWVPALYFDSLDQVRDLHTSLPLLVYRCIEPCSGRARCHLTYDPADLSDLQKAVRSANRRFPRLMYALMSEAEAEGKPLTGQVFLLRDPKHMLKWTARHPRQIAALLTTETFVIEEFVRLVDMLREVKSLLLSPSANTVRQLAHFVEDFVAVLNRRLRRIYGTDCSVLAPLLLLEATNALQARDEVEATLTIEAKDRTLAYKAIRAK